MQAIEISDLWRVVNPLRLAGPIFDKELRVASRRGRTYLLRFAYVAILSCFILFTWAGTVLAYSVRSPSVVQASQMGLAAMRIVGTIVWFQFIMSQVLAVVLLSGAIGEEVRKRSLDALLVTPISSLQIVLGKLLSRLLQLCLLLTASLPLLAVVRVFGGVPWGYVISSLCITLTAALVTGSLSLFLSMADRNTNGVVAGVICWCVVVWGFLPWAVSALRHTGYAGYSPAEMVLYSINPFLVLADQSSMMATASASVSSSQKWLLHCLIMLGIAAVILVLSVRRVRRIALAPTPGGVEAARKDAAPNRLSRRTIRRIRGSPIVWRELKRPVLPRNRRGWFQAVTLVLVAGAAVGALIFSFRAMQGNPATLFVIACLGLIVVFVINVACSSAAAITREKEGRTLQVLLTIPHEERQIVRDKATGILRRNAPLLIPVPILGLMACLGGVAHTGLSNVAWISVWFCLSLVGHAVFLMGLGFYLSVCLKTTTAATAWTFVLFVIAEIMSSVFLPPMIGLLGGLPGLLVSQIMQLMVYMAFGWILWHDAAQSLRANCLR
jgi:ABC-type transport system involved in multi-copper enzyme maturation permease subunit